MTAIRLDELLAKALLQLGDALADRRLTDIEAACNLGHGAPLASRQSVSSPSSNMRPPSSCVGRGYLRGWWHQGKYRLRPLIAASATP
jgi:hypothetical protein